MNDKEFSNVLDDTILKSVSILKTKAGEYAKGDRLHNFKVAAKLGNCTPEMALRGMMAKHIVSVWDLVKDTEEGKSVSADLWDEKIIDSINYLILLRAIIIDREQVVNNE